MYDVVDFIEHGSDHSPVYVRLRVYPSWRKSSNTPRKRILKSSGIEKLEEILRGESRSKQRVIGRIKGAFSHIDWSSAMTRKDMNNLWSLWQESYGSLVEEIIGTRWARVSSWGRKFDMEVRELCKKASVARSWFVEAKRARGGCREAFCRLETEP